MLQGSIRQRGHPPPTLCRIQSLPCYTVVIPDAEQDHTPHLERIALHDPRVRIYQGWEEDALDQSLTLWSTLLNQGTPGLIARAFLHTVMPCSQRDAFFGHLQLHQRCEDHTAQHGDVRH